MMELAKMVANGELDAEFIYGEGEHAQLSVVAAHDDHGQLAGIPAGDRPGEVQPVHELRRLLPGCLLATERGRGRVVWNAKYCKGCLICVNECTTEALSKAYELDFEDGVVRLEKPF